MIKRREFIAGLGSAAAVSSSLWPLPARAQQADRMRLIGVLTNLAEDDPEGRVRYATFRQALQDLGWTIGRNLRIEYRWGGNDPGLYRKYAAELVALAPDVLLAGGGLAVRPLQQATHNVPIVFTNTNDPIAFGFVSSLARPGGNTTGFINIESTLSTKWLWLLKQVAPSVRRAAVLWAVPSGKTQLDAMQAAARSLDMELTPIDLHGVNEIVRDVAAFAREPGGGLIVTASTLATRNRELILTLASRHRLPAVYPNRLYAARGGLASYGPIFLDQFRAAAGYVDRILKGENPANLPVQAPTRYQTVLNLNTAKALDLELPADLLALADEVIE
jgi:putative tryptophan/tyrosine transport system substrate-binding protein